MKITYNKYIDKKSKVLKLDIYIIVLKKGGKVMDFVIHPQFIGRACRVNMLGELISYMKERGAWIARNKEIAEWVLKQYGFEA